MLFYHTMRCNSHLAKPELWPELVDFWKSVIGAISYDTNCVCVDRLMLLCFAWLCFALLFILQDGWMGGRIAHSAKRKKKTKRKRSTKRRKRKSNIFRFGEVQTKLFTNP